MTIELQDEGTTARIDGDRESALFIDDYLGDNLLLTIDQNGSGIDFRPGIIVSLNDLRAAVAHFDGR